MQQTKENSTVNCSANRKNEHKTTHSWTKCQSAARKESGRKTTDYSTQL